MYMYMCMYIRTLVCKCIFLYILTISVAWFIVSVLNCASFLANSGEYQITILLKPVPKERGRGEGREGWRGYLAMVTYKSKHLLIIRLKGGILSPSKHPKKRYLPICTLQLPTNVRTCT